MSRFCSFAAREKSGRAGARGSGDNENDCIHSYSSVKLETFVSLIKDKSKPFLIKGENLRFYKHYKEFH